SCLVRRSRVTGSSLYVAPTCAISASMACFWASSWAQKVLWSMVVGGEVVGGSVGSVDSGGVLVDGGWVATGAVPGGGATVVTGVVVGSALGGGSTGVGRGGGRRGADGAGRGGGGAGGAVSKRAAGWRWSWEPRLPPTRVRVRRSVSRRAARPASTSMSVRSSSPSDSSQPWWCPAPPAWASAHAQDRPSSGPA